MKKLFFTGALALSTFTLANTKDEVKEIKQENTKEVKELTKEQKHALMTYFRWWSVSYTNACGTTNTVFFQSDNPDQSPAFIDELAYAVNSTYGDC
ncbi:MULTISPECIES: hypothetical protein [Chryseobacterium]|uniref:hypothetical protein n=1 Tax=Chryseobacterium TaxID=59732 RepID=UPI001E302BE2|nr:hypothetical protein [Chryseobacterium gleum]MCE4066200.1 hypothetical protein [Chryseobacterium gleum]